MAQKAAFIKIPLAESGIPQTMPTEPEARIRKEDIEIQRCTEEDAPKIVEGLYTAFPEAWWSKMEPPEMRPTQAIREERLTKRILPSFKLPHVHWIKAVHLPTGTIAGVAGWQGPVSWLPNVLNHASAADFYGWKGGVWTQEEFDEMWAGTDIGAWDGSMKKGDDVRREILAGEKHWYLAPLFT